MSVYNGFPYLAAAVESILGQTFDDLEFIVVDDGSVDGTWEYLCRCAQSDSRLILLRNSVNLGYTRSLNRGLLAVRGRFMARQDADDVSLPERFEKQVAFFQAHPDVGVVGSGIDIIDEHGKCLVSPPIVEDNGTLQVGLLSDFCLHHGSVMLSMACLNFTGYYDVAMEPTEDHDLWLRLAEVTQLANLPERLYQYRRHSSSVSNQRSGEQRFRMSQSIERAFLRRTKMFQLPAARRQLALSYFYAAITYIAGPSLQQAQQCLAHSMAYWPELLTSEDALIHPMEHYTGSLPLNAAIEFYDLVFEQLLPHTLSMSWLKARLTSQLYMRRVFSGTALDERVALNEYLWEGLRLNPFWLANRGVLSRIGRSMRQSIHNVLPRW